MDASTRTTVARAIATFLGLFTLLNGIAGMARRYFDANCWWIDLRPLPGPVALTFLIICGAMLVALGIQPAMGIIRRRISLSLMAILCLISTINCIVYFALLMRRTIHSDFPIPFSLFILAILIFIAVSLRKSPVKAVSTPLQRLITALTLAACAILFPLAQMFCFGLTDYRRPADAIVVFGARTYANGQPADALADRVRTACELYHQGLAPTIIFSGGPGDGATHETEAMRNFAISLGVPDSAIIRDVNGLSTASTVADTVPVLSAMNARRILVVTHFYHLPRVKLSYSRAGVDVFTVPATQLHPLNNLPKLMAREVVALWEYYADPLLPPGVRMRS